MARLTAPSRPRSAIGMNAVRKIEKKHTYRRRSTKQRVVRVRDDMMFVGEFWGWGRELWVVRDGFCL